MGTIFEANRKKNKKANKRRPTCGFDNEQLDDSGVSLSPPEQDDNPQRFTLLSNFSYQLLQTVSVFGGWILEFVPFINFGRARRQHIAPSSASGITATAAVNAAALQAGQQNPYHNSETEVDVEEELYNNFLRNETIDDQDDDEYNEDSQAAEGSLEDEQDEVFDDVGEAYVELLSLGNDIREQVHYPASNSSNSSGLQLFITHLVHSPVLTRTQYRRLTQTPPASAVYDEAAALLTLMEERQAVSDTLTHPITDRLCVICHTEPRQCLLKPCR